MRRRRRPVIRRAAAEAPAPEEEHVDESINDPRESTPVETSQTQAGPSQSQQPSEQEGRNINIEQMAQILAAALQAPRETERTIERARKLGAKPYDGTGEPERALSWLENNEEIFGLMKCTEDEKLTFSTFLLKDRAKDWWRSIQRRNPNGVSWTLFKKEFIAKFYPKSYKDAKIEEFFKFEQGIMTVAEYEKKFSELVRVVPFIADDEEQKANRFAAGLKPEIRAYLASTTHTQYGQLVEAAIRVERNVAAIPQSSKLAQKRSSTSGFQGRPSKFTRSGGKSTWSGSQKMSQGAQSSQSSVKMSSGARGASGSMRTWPTCNQCGKMHPGECLKGRSVCYRCGREGHFMKECPNVASTGRSDNRPAAPGQTSSTRGPDRRGPQTRGPTTSSQPSGAVGRGVPFRGQPGDPAPRPESSQ